MSEQQPEVDEEFKGKEDLFHQSFQKHKDEDEGEWFEFQQGFEPPTEDFQMSQEKVEKIKKVMAKLVLEPPEWAKQ